MKTQLRLAAILLVVGGLGGLGWFFRSATDNGQLTWEPPVVKKSLTTAAYQAYGNPTAQNGRNFLSKITFRNNGSGPVRDFAISYQIPDYVPWTLAEMPAEIQAGRAVEKRFYPHLPAKVTQLAGPTMVTLETKIHWSDKPGATREEVLRSNVELRPINEIAYTDLAVNEVLNWDDQFATAPFCAALVTPDDPVVQEFMAEVVRSAGGSTVGVAGDPQEIARLMKAVYDYLCATGMRYTGEAGVPAKLGDSAATWQTVRLPRDVIIANEGLGIELALLWASAMEHLGVRTSLAFVPGHVFDLVWVGQDANDFIPIDCTAITPPDAGSKTPRTFGEAVQSAQQQMDPQKSKMMVDVQQYQLEGFVLPELPPIDIDQIKKTFAERNAHKTRLAPQEQSPALLASLTGLPKASSPPTPTAPPVAAPAIPTPLATPPPATHAAPPSTPPPAARTPPPAARTPPPSALPTPLSTPPPPALAAPTGTPSAPAPPEPTASATPRAVAPGFFRYKSPGDWVTVDIPAQWVRIEHTPISGMIFAAQDTHTSMAINVYRFTKLTSTAEAVQSIQSDFSFLLGIRSKYDKTGGDEAKHEVITYKGTATSLTGTNAWVGMFQVTRGGVLGFVIGDSVKTHEQNKQLTDTIYDSVYFGK